MCRHLAYLGPPVSLHSLLIDPPHGLYRQSWAPRMQKHGTVNADGFGVGWYAPGDPVPARYRRAIPIWGDPSLPDIARVVSSTAVLAAVRSATPGMALGEGAAAPFRAGAWLFSHNGVLEHWASPATQGTRLAQDTLADGGTPFGPGTPFGQDPPLPPASQLPRVPPLPQASLAAMEAVTDSAYLWSIVAGLLRDGASPAAALARAIGAVRDAGGSGRFNFLWTDGATIAATACGDTLWYRAVTAGSREDSVTVASEPCDDLPGWTEVPDQHVLTAIRGLVETHPLSAFTTRSPNQ